MEQPLSYVRPTTSGDAGWQYELKMTALIALRLLNHDSVEQFYLSNNNIAGEKFDDLVYAANIDNVWETKFIQLKHRLAISRKHKTISKDCLRKETKKNSDFYLKKYFESFKKVADKLEDSDVDDVVFSRGIESATFLLFTSGVLHDEIKNENSMQHDIGLLSTNGSNEFNIQFDVDDNKDLFHDIPEKSQLKTFLSKFYFCSQQALENELDVLIDKELFIGAPKITQNDINNARNEFYRYIRRWYNENEFLTKEKVKSELSEIVLQLMSGRKKEVPIKFVSTFLDSVCSVFKNDRVIHFVSKASSIIVCRAALEERFVAPNKCFELSQLEDPKVRECFSSAVKEMMVFVDCESKTQTEDNILKEVASFIKILSSQHTIILMSIESNEKASKLANLTGAKKKIFNCTINNVHKECKPQLMNMAVKFQDHEATLSSIVGEDNTNMLLTVIQLDIITNILQGDKPQIGIKPLETIPYYVPRQLQRTTVSQEIFERSNSIFAVSRIKEDKIRELFPRCTVSTVNNFTENPTLNVKIIVLSDSPRKQFTEISKLLKENKTMHWLQKKNREWVWKESTNNADECLDYKTDIVTDIVETDNILEIYGNIVLITADPGMGKSTLLIHLAEETKKINPELWVVLITLNDYTNELSSNSFMTDIKSATKSIIAKAAGVSSKTSRLDSRLFDHCYDVTGNMVVLLDGFDEITPYYTDQGLALVRALKETSIKRIWITTRPALGDTLLNSTNTIPYNIRPFNKDDQRDFLRKYWKGTVPKVGEVDFIDKVLNQAVLAIGNDVNEFMGIPLQTQMIAEIFEPYLLAPETLSNDPIDSMKLFQMFIQRKLEILTEKSKNEKTNAAFLQQFKVISEAYQKKLMQLGLITLLNEEELKKIRPSMSTFQVAKLKDYVNLGEEKTGIVTKFHGTVPQFVHRTFAEYFVAVFLVENYEDNSEFLTSMTYYSSSFKFVRHFLDKLLSKGFPLHDAVLDRSLEKIDTLLRTPEVVTSQDSKGRTALHLAVSQPNAEDIIRRLLDAGAEVEMQDDLKLTPVQIALKAKQRENADLVIRGIFGSG